MKKIITSQLSLPMPVATWKNWMPCNILKLVIISQLQILQKIDLKFDICHPCPYLICRNWERPKDFITCRVPLHLPDAYRQFYYELCFFSQLKNIRSPHQIFKQCHKCSHQILPCHTGGRAYGINIFGQIHSRLTNQTVYKTVRLAPKYKTLSWNIFPHFKYLIFLVIYLNEAFRSESLPGVDHKINWVISTIQNSLDIFWELLRLIIMNSILLDNFV